MSDIPQPQRKLMKYESDNLKITDQDEMLDDVDKQIVRLRAGIVDVLQGEKVEMKIALSVVATMYINIAKGMMDLPKEITLEAITQAIEMAYAEDEMEEVEWLN